jgi:hypothetical protein
VHCVRDLNPGTGEISLNLDLNSKTGEKSPDRGFHAATVAGARRLASSGFRRLTAEPGLPVPPDRGLRLQARSAHPPCLS